jgi:NCS1 nucleoside transporter family
VPVADVAPVDDPSRNYGDKVVAVEPGGIEPIPLDERHGRPLGLFWTWVSPNMEFATVAVGMLAVLYWGLNLAQATAAIILGTALGSISHGVLSTWGPRDGLAQMMLSRIAFGRLGNLLPAGLNAATAGIGWFAVNSISGALALHALAPAVPKELALVIVVAAQLLVAFFGHNLVHAFERFAFPILSVIFVIAAVIVLTKANAAAQFTKFAPPRLGGFLLTVGASLGYAVGWNPYASDYTRYLPPDTRRPPVGLAAGFGVFTSCVLLEVAGAAAVTAVGGNAGVDPSTFTGLTPTVIGKLTLLAVMLGSIAANVLNVYSGAMSFMALGVRLPLHRARAVVAVAFGIVGFIVASFGLGNAGQNYEDFLLIIAYWITPWLGVVFVDRLLRRGKPTGIWALTPGYRNWAGPVAMLVGIVVSIWLFSNQTKYVGPVPSAHPAVGDLTPEVGFVISAVLYFVLFLALRPRTTVSEPAHSVDYAGR